MDFYGQVLWLENSYLKINNITNLNSYNYLLACLSIIKPIINEINTGDQAADIYEIVPFTPSELNIKLNT